MRKMWDKVWNDDRGNVLVIMAATMPLLIGTAGLATDTVQWTLWKRQLQRAADSAAIAGVYERVQVGANQTKVEAAVTEDLSLNNNTGIALSTGYPKVTMPAATGDQSIPVRVELAIERRLSFSGMFMRNPPLIEAGATAASTPGTDEYCVVSLESQPITGITGSGNAGVEMDCGMITNSVASNSAIAKGNVKMKATVIASVGGIKESDNWQVEKYDPYVRQQKDPYAGVSPSASDMDCSTSKVVVRGGQNTTISTAPALDETYDFSASDTANGGKKTTCFSSLSVGSGKTLNLPAGTYYINGGDANIQGTLTGTNVTIVLTNSSTAANATIGKFTMNASGLLDLKAPESGTFKDIAIYQDRRAVNINSQTPNKINGNSTSKVHGALYFPNQGLEYNGNGTSTAICTLFVARRITFSGNNTTSNKFTSDASVCGSNGPKGFQGGQIIRLVA
ncbi:pilus assembly protein TadG-related protein [Sphingomicrobium sp. XHP0235]|uniref:pilus assembly protein TadG-related protein n=1 Tax=Sphingomicrobium aquimarinum TaxID=3133971 RepID=UPI0031FE4E1D